LGRSASTRPRIDFGLAQTSTFGDITSRPIVQARLAAADARPDSNNSGKDFFRACRRTFLSRHAFLLGAWSGPTYLKDPSYGHQN
jgi:hypothetical protein